MEAADDVLAQTRRLGPRPAAWPKPISVVVLSCNRIDELARTLRHLVQLPQVPPIVVVDNASDDGSADHVRWCFPQIEVVQLPQNLGASARNAGVDQVRTPYVAFCDDDTWWAPDALRRATALMNAHPRVGAVAARVLVGPHERLAPACQRMAESPLPSEGLPGPRLLNFMAGAVVMRTEAFRAVGGYEPRFFIGAEEMLMGLDLSVHGWDVVYAADVVAHQHPSLSPDRMRRRLLSTRNRLWVAWMRLPLGDALTETRRLLRQASSDGLLELCLTEALRGLGWALRRRDVLPPDVSSLWHTLRHTPPLASAPGH